MTNPSVAAVQREHQPALDGVRGVSVAMVLLFHGGFSFMTGGYVGVSVFFTLSGFLIIRLLLDERDTTGRISASHFYARRVRRLMPASLLCLAAVSVAAWLGEFDGLPHLRRDILFSLFQVANWNALSAGTSYADLVARSTGRLGPVDHFWSLAVEEQFYWLWPLVCAVLMVRGGSTRSTRRSIVMLAVVGVAAAPVIAHVWGANAAYWATPARLGEILTGAALAVVLHGRTWNWFGVQWLGLAGLAVIVWAAVRWPAGSGPAYSGWLGVFSLASVALIAALQVPGTLRSALGVRPLAYLGRISYGVYLYHWPVFAIVDARRVGGGPWAVFAVRVAVTLAIAVASFHLLEVRIRHGRSSGRRLTVATVGAIAAVVALVMLAVPAPPPTFSAPTDVPETFATTTTSAPVESVVGSTTPVPEGPVTVLLLGDSTMGALSEGLVVWADARPDEMQVASLAAPGCGLVRGSVMDGDEQQVFETECADRLDSRLPALLAQGAPDVVAIMVTVSDMVRRTWSAQEGQLSIADDRYRERLVAAYRATADELIGAGVRRIAWVVPPVPAGVRPTDPDEWARFVAVVRQMADDYPDVVELVPLDEWLASQADAVGLRPDGLHLSPAGALEVSERFMADALMRIAHR